MEAQCCAVEHPVLPRCLWVSFSTFCVKRPQSVFPQGHVKLWLCPSNLSSCPSVSGPFPAQGNTYYCYAQAHAWGLLPGFDFVCLVLWGLVKRLPELEKGKEACNSLEEPREGLYFVNCFIPVKMFIGVCWKVPFSQCALPSVCQFALLLCLQDSSWWQWTGCLVIYTAKSSRHQTLRSLLWGSCAILELLSVSNSPITEAKCVKPKHFMGSLFDARISLVS